MSDTPRSTAAATADALADAGPGLAQGGKPGDAQPSRAGADLIDAAAGGAELKAKEADDLLGYFLTNEGMPGDEDVVDLELTLGHGDRARAFKCSIHTIEWSEWQDARDRATDVKTGEFDTYVSASWIVARALVTPKLGPTIMAMQAEDKDTAPGDSAALLRRMFKRQSGALLELSGKVLEISKLQNENNAVKEVEAGKR